VLEYIGDAAEENLQIHPEGQVRGVLAVIARLHINGQLIASVDLCKTRQAGANVIGMYLVARFDQIILVVERRARADDTHLPGQNIVDLGQLIKARLAQKCTAAGYVAVGILQQMGRHIMGGISAHRAEFKNVKMRFALADTALLEKDRSRGIRLDPQRNDPHWNCQKDRSGQ